MMEEIGRVLERCRDNGNGGTGASAAASQPQTLEMLKKRFRTSDDLPIFRKTAAGGHFGRNDPDFTWESTDAASKLAERVGTVASA